MKRIPEMLVSFQNLQGHARRVLNHNVQKNLIEMGYLWSDEGWDCQPKHVDAPFIHLGSHRWNPTHMSFIGAGEPIPHGGVVIIDASRDLDKFFSMAKEAIEPHEFNIDGAVCRIGPNSIQMDLNAIVEQITAKAKLFQQQTFNV